MSKDIGRHPDSVLSMDVGIHLSTVFKSPFVWEQTGKKTNKIQLKKLPMININYFVLNITPRFSQIDRGIVSF